MLENYITFTAVCALIALFNKRLGLWLMLVVGLLGDPVRKLTPGNPVYISVIFVGIFVIVYFSYKKIYTGSQGLITFFPKMMRLLKVFFFILAINGLRPLLINIAYLSLVVYSGVQYTGILIAANLGYSIMDSKQKVVKYTDVFIITLLPYLFSVLLHFWGFDAEYPILRVMMKGGKWLRYDAHGIISMLCGLFRNPEGMGWFSMIVSVSACFLLTYKKRNLKNILYYGSVFILSSFCVIVSGRRKYFLGIIMYILVFIIISMRKSLKKGITFLIFFIIAFLSLIHYTGGENKSESYVKSVKTLSETTKHRIENSITGSIAWAIRRDGFFGRGLGTSTQGTQHFAQGLGQRGYIEAGPGKVVSELGVPGLIVFFMIVFYYLTGVYKAVIKGSFKDTKEIVGIFLLALLLTQMAIFTISHQIFGDPLVAILTGLMAGFLMAVPRFMSVAEHKNEGSGIAKKT